MSRRVLAVMDTLIALLATQGPCTADLLARLSGGHRWLVHRRLRAAWGEDLVSVIATTRAGDVWRLTARGRARAVQLREDEPRFARLARTR